MARSGAGDSGRRARRVLRRRRCGDSGGPRRPLVRAGRHADRAGVPNPGHRRLGCSYPWRPRRTRRCRLWTARGRGRRGGAAARARPLRQLDGGGVRPLRRGPARLAVRAGGPAVRRISASATWSWSPRLDCWASRGSVLVSATPPRFARAVRRTWIAASVAPGRSLGGHRLSASVRHVPLLAAIPAALGSAPTGIVGWLTLVVATLFTFEHSPCRGRQRRQPRARRRRARAAAHTGHQTDPGHPAACTASSSRSVQRSCLSRSSRPAQQARLGGDPAVRHRRAPARRRHWQGARHTGDCRRRRPAAWSGCARGHLRRRTHARAARGTGAPYTSADPSAREPRYARARQRYGRGRHRGGHLASAGRVEWLAQAYGACLAWTLLMKVAVLFRLRQPRAEAPYPRAVQPVRRVAESGRSD